MAISATQYIDLLVKKIYGVAKTDTSTNKGYSNETVASPLINRGDKIYLQTSSIPSSPAAVTGIVQANTGTNAVQCTYDNTTVPVGSVYPTWKTGLTDWIPPEFGTGYAVSVYVGSSDLSNPTTQGTQIFAAGEGGANPGEFWFDYQAGVLNFIGQTIPPALTSTGVVYISGYRYIGKTGAQYLIANTGPQLLTGNVAISNTTPSISNTTGALTVTGGLGVTGNVYVDSLVVTTNNVTANAVTVDAGIF
jgi:hypothetical protein